MGNETAARADHCPACDEEITGKALDAGVVAGCEWHCPECGVRLDCHEHTDGYTDWMTFHRRR